MQRRDLFKGAFAAGLLSAPQRYAQTVPTTEVVIERAVSGRPYKGKVLALVTPHLDDGPFFASGTVTKLLDEGYTQKRRYTSKQLCRMEDHVGVPSDGLEAEALENGRLENQSQENESLGK